jgi:hypothetical protein
LEDLPELTLLAEVAGKVIDVSLALPDINQILKRIKKGRLLPFGIIKLLWHKRKIDIMGVIKSIGTRVLTYVLFTTCIATH